MDEKELHQKEILGLINSTEPDSVIKDKLDDFHENDIADVLPLLTGEKWRRLCSILDTPRIADVIEHTDENEAEAYIEQLDDKKAAKILSAMEPDKAVDFLKNTDSEKKGAWLALMDQGKREKLLRLAAYDEGTIGSRMTTNFICVKTSMSVQDARELLIQQSQVHDNISTLYAVKDDGTYAGAFELKSLILAHAQDPLTEIIIPGYPNVYADEKIDDCIPVIKDYSEESIPVLSRGRKILGVVTANDVVEVVDDAMGDDYAKLGGLTAEADLNEPLSTSIKKRLPWLVLLLFLGMGVSSVVSLYENVVAKLTIIMAFQSMVLDMSGNVGTQSLAVTIRVLMDENLKFKDKVRLMKKEISAGFCNGILLGFIALATVGIYLMVVKGKPAPIAFGISACIGLSLVIALFISSFVGTAITMFFKQIGVDPAVASGPLITTVTDLVGIITYYSLAWIMLVRLLGA